MSKLELVAVPLCETYCLSFLGWILKKRRKNWLQWIQITCVQGRGDWLLINEWRQLGAFPSQPIRVWREGLKEVGNGAQVGPTLILNLSLTHCRPGPDSLPARNSVCLTLCWDFFAAPFHSKWAEILFILTTKVTSHLHQGRPYLCKCFFWLNLVYLNRATWNLQFLTFYFTGELVKAIFSLIIPWRGVCSLSKKLILGIPCRYPHIFCLFCCGWFVSISLPALPQYDSIYMHEYHKYTACQSLDMFMLQHNSVIITSVH